MPLATSLSLLAAVSIWIEGEQPLSSTFNQHSWYSAVQRDQRSPDSPGVADGDCLAHFANNSTPVQAT